MKGSVVTSNCVDNCDLRHGCLWSVQVPPEGVSTVQSLSSSTTVLHIHLDYSKFMDDDFDPKEWVNTAFRSQKDGSKDQYATTLVMKLQMFIQEVNNVVEDSCQQAIQNLPRVQRELEAVRQEAKLLQEQMTAVRTDIQKVEHDTSQSMQMLQQLDTIKSRMKEASDALQEADKWTTLSADVDEVFDSQDIQAISQKLVGMSQSLQVLTDVPDYTERCQFLETLKNRLEAMLSPQLISAFNSQSIEESQVYVRIFCDMDRLPQLCKYYHTCRRGQLLQTWRNIQEDKSEDTLVEWLNEFYDSLLSTWHAQMKWCSQLFQEQATSMVCHLISDSLISLDPSIPSCITTLLNEQPEPLPMLINLKQISERFAKNMENISENLPEVKSVPSNQAHFEKLAAAIYSPYQIFVAEYSTLEEGVLRKELDNIQLDHSEIIDCVQLLVGSVSKIFSSAKEANDRCVQLTNGCGYVSLIHAYKSLFSSYISEFRRVVSNLREKCQPQTQSTDVEDWTWFQHSLRLIQTCGDLLVHLEELDQTLVSDIVRTVGAFVQPPSSPVHGSRQDVKKLNAFQDFSTLLIDRLGERQALEAMYTSLEEGDTPSLLDEIKKELGGLSEYVHKFAFDIVFAPLRVQLSQVPSMEMWSSETAGGALASDLPNFSLSPLEYITKVGQYLLTLPQQLEPFTLQDNPTLIVALKYGKLPYNTQQEFQEEHLADIWLESVARGTMQTCIEQVLRIPSITKAATRQLSTDIDYLCNVLEDLGLASSDNLQDLNKLLQASPADYDSAAAGLPQRLASAVSKMRHLSSE